MRQLSTEITTFYINNCEEGSETKIPIRGRLECFLDSENYRPVALTSHLIKVLERVLRRVLVKHIEDNDIIPAGQHGSRTSRSTLTQLLSHWNTILGELDKAFVLT